MDIEDVEKIFEETETEWEGNNTTQGLAIINSFLPDSGVEGADHDIIYSCDVEDLIKAGAKKEDFEKLAKLNWMVQDRQYLACFV